MLLPIAGHSERKVKMALDYEIIGKRIKRYRMDRKLSQDKLGDIVHITGRHISSIETGAKGPSLEMLIMIANALDVSADDLLTDNLKHSSSPVNTELHDLLLDCNNDEKDILIKLVKYAKVLLVEHGI